MTNKRIIYILIGVTVVFVSAVFLFLSLKHEVEYFGSEVPDGYIAVFHGGSGEITYSTYIYKIDNKILYVIVYFVKKNF